MSSQSLLLKPNDANAVFAARLPSFERLDADRRLSELDRYDVLDTPSEEAFDRITRLVCRLFAVPMATVTFIDGHRHGFKSRQGVEAAQCGRDIALCRVPTAEERPLVVPNTLDDPRFRDNPLVTDGPCLRFYAGVPVRSARGEVIGTLVRDGQGAATVRSTRAGFALRPRQAG